MDPNPTKLFEFIESLTGGFKLTSETKKKISTQNYTIETFSNIAKLDKEKALAELNKFNYLDGHSSMVLSKLKNSQCTFHDLLTSELSELNDLVDFDSDLSTQNDVTDCPKKFQHWQEFDRLLEKFNQYVKNAKTPTFERYIQAEVEKGQVLSHHQLVNRFENLCNHIFTNRIFDGIIHWFLSTPEQNEKTVGCVGGVLPNNGDLFYAVKSRNANYKFLFVNLMVVKTRTSLPIDLYCDAKDYETLLPDIYNGENSVLGLTQQRVRNLVSQMKDIMKSDSNQNFKNVFTLISTFETTFVLYYDNEKEHLWISRPLSRDKLLTVMFFVLSIQLYQRGYFKDIPEDLLAILQELPIDIQLG